MNDDRICQTIVVANQKGGCGKTTTVFNLAGAFAHQGLKMLLIDLDPQGNLSSSFTSPKEIHINDLFFDQNITPEQTNIKNIDLIPSDKKLSALVPELSIDTKRNFFLDEYVSSLSNYDIILIDTPPTLGSFLTVGALAADFFLIPINPSYYTLQGTRDLMGSMKKIRNKFRPSLQFIGATACMHDKRTAIARDVLAEVRSFYEKDFLEPVITRAVKIEESQVNKTPMIHMFPKDSISKSYLALAENILRRMKDA